jgi:hypothetical protein
MNRYIPDEHAQILWNDGEDGKVVDFCIVDYRDTKLQSSIADRYNNSNGADSADWLTHPHPFANPAGLFAYLAFRNGFFSKGAEIECVREFAQLESCEWARKMLAAIEFVEQE